MNVVRAILLIILISGASAAAESPESNVYTETISGTLVTFDMVRVPQGWISIPNPVREGAKRWIRVKPIWVGKMEVTWDEFDVYALGLDEPEQGKDAVSRPSKPYGAVDRGYGHKGYPAINVSYHAAEQYCKWLSAKTGKNYRLPTEAEWEYACRAGKPEPTRDRLADFAWFWQEKTQPVGKKQPNAWGLYDMLGNVGEWCAGIDGRPVLCGGSFEDMAAKVRPSTRVYQDESWQANDPQNPKSKWWLSDGQFVGFRIVMVDG